MQILLYVFISTSVCPLDFPNANPVMKGCGNEISNQTACCNAMAGYVSHLQKQSFTTNLQALDCAASLGMKLQKVNITKNVYDLCHITLKDFSLQGLSCLSMSPQVCWFHKLKLILIRDLFVYLLCWCDVAINILNAQLDRKVNILLVCYLYSHPK